MPTIVMLSCRCVDGAQGCVVSLIFLIPQRARNLSSKPLQNILEPPNPWPGTTVGGW